MSLCRLFALSLTFSFLSLAVAVDASASKRVALVVGNNDYTTLAALNNAEKDARDMAQTLRGLGWEVVDLYNSSLRDTGRAISKFEGLLMTAEAALFFYAGHGIQAKGENWLVPVDAEVEAEVDLEYEAITVRKVLRSMKNADVPVNILILDACRDNPLKKRTRSASRGLKTPEVPSGLRGTTILFSAAPGEVAQDGPQGGNGVFTGKLLAELKRPGQTLEEVFKATARGVNAATNRSQRPWFNSSLSGDFYLNEAKPEPEPKQVAAVSPVAPVPAVPNVEIVYWQSVVNSKDPEVLQSYLNQYPNGQFAALAKVRIESLRKSYEDRKQGGALRSQAVSKTTDLLKDFDPKKIQNIRYVNEEGTVFEVDKSYFKLGSFWTKNKRNEMFAGVFRSGSSVLEKIRNDYDCLTALGDGLNWTGDSKFYFDYWNKKSVSYIRENGKIEENLELTIGGSPNVWEWVFSGKLLVEDGLIKYQSGKPEFKLDKSLYQNAKRKEGTIKDMRLSISAVLDKDFGLAKSIFEKWEFCGKEVEVNWTLESIEYKAKKYAYITN
ncbi:MAG: caspase family protein [Alphaproteobacteria bacterium]|nr:caspase family protein [Alphaproteobacteria bacterium]